MTTDPLSAKYVELQALRASVRTEEKALALRTAEEKAQARIAQAEVQFAMDVYRAIQAGAKPFDIRRDVLRTQNWGTWKRYADLFPASAAGEKAQAEERKVKYRVNEGMIMWLHDQHGEPLPSPVEVRRGDDGTWYPDLGLGRDYFEEHFGGLAKFVALVGAEVSDS